MSISSSVISYPKFGFELLKKMTYSMLYIRTETEFCYQSEPVLTVIEHAAFAVPIFVYHYLILYVPNNFYITGELLVWLNMYTKTVT